MSLNYTTGVVQKFRLVFQGGGGIRKIILLALLLSACKIKCRWYKHFD